MLGIKKAKNDIIITNHSDCQFSFDVLIPFVNVLENKNFIIFPKRVNRSIFSQVRSLFVKIVCSLILSRKIPDVNGQPKMFNANKIKKLKSWPTGFAFDLFLYCFLRNSDTKIYIPEVKEKKRTMGVSSWNISIISQLRFFKIYLRDCLKIRDIKNQNRYDNN